MVQSELIAPEVKPVTGISEKRWSAWMIFLTGLCRPATTARRTRHASLFTAYLVHLVASVVITLIVFELAAWLQNDSLLEIVAEVLEELTRWNQRRPEEMLAAVVGTVLGIEAGFVALALLLTPWGAGDEPLRASVKHALRQVWLHTASAVPLVLLVGVLLVSYVRERQRYFQVEYRAVQLPAYPIRPRPPWQPGKIPTTQEVDAYNQAMADYTQAIMAYSQQYNQMWEEQRRRMPWVVRYGEELSATVGFAAGIVLLGVLLRAVGIDRGAAPVARPPTCDRCGYNLTTLPLEARCPECGERVMESLGPMARPGAAWERRSELGRWAAYVRTARDAGRRDGLGRQIVVSSRRTAHRGYLAMHLPLIFLIGYGSLLGCYVVDMRRNPFRHEVEVAWLAAPMVGVLLAVGFLATALLAAGAIGLFIGWPQKRNLQSAAMQVAAYLLPVGTLGCVLSGLLAISMFWLKRHWWLRGLQSALHIDDEVLAFFGWLVPSALMALGYLFLVYRGTAETRYANR